MAKQFQFSYQCPPIGLVPPQTNGAAITGAYKSLRNAAGKVAIVAHINLADAAAVTVTPLQAQDDVGTGSKAINAVPIFFNVDTSLSDTLVAQPSAANFATDLTLKDKIVVFEFDPADALDLANGFDHIALQFAASNVANIVEGHMEYLGRYQQVSPPASEV